MKKRIQRFIITCITGAMLLTCTACNPTELEISGSSAWDTQLAVLKDREIPQLPDRLEVKVTDTVDINASILLPEGKKDNEASRLTLKRHIYSEDQVKENALTLIKAGALPKEPDKIERTMDGGAYEDEKERVRYDLNVDTYTGVASLANTMKLTTNEGARLLEALWYPFDDESVQFCYRENQELDFGRWEDAWNDIKDLSDRCGIESITSMRCFSLDRESLQKFLDRRLEENGGAFYFKETGSKPQYTEEDEAYFFEFQQGFEGIPICKYQLDQTLEKQDFGYGSYAYGNAIYSTKGLIYFNMDNLFDLEKSGEKQKLVPLSQVLDQSVAGLKNLVAGRSSAQIREISLCYLPVLKDAAAMEFEAEPVWVIAYIQSDTYTGEVSATLPDKKYDVYNAFTGEKMY